MKLLIAFAFFAASANGIIVECDFFFANFNFVGSLYICEATIKNFRNPKVLESVVGDYFIGNTANEVRAVVGSGVLFGEFFDNWAEFFPNVTLFEFSGGEIKNISASKLKPFEGLTYLNLWRNEIVSIDGDLFQHNPNIKYVNFEDNLLENIGENLIVDLGNLKEVNFRNNPCIFGFAASRREIVELNRLLPINCPPLTTTPSPPPPTTSVFPPNECSLRCTLSQEFDVLNQNVTFMDFRIGAQNKNIYDQSVTNQKLQAIVEELQISSWEQTGLISYLESQVRNKIAVIEELNAKITDQSKDITGHEGRLAGLEMQMRELAAHPCFSCSQP